MPHYEKQSKRFARSKIARPKVLMMSRQRKESGSIPSVQPYVHFEAWPICARFFKGPRILIQEITRGRTLRAGFTDEEFYNNPGIINVVPKQATAKIETPSLLFFAALCNSALFFFWHIRNSPKAKLVTSIPKILVEDVARLPIRCIDFATSTTKRTAQLESGKESCEKSVVAKDAKNALQFAEAELKDGRTDVVHDLLAFLAEQMIAMNQEKRMTAKQFLTDLKDFHNIDSHALNPKAKLDEFWKLEALDLFAHLHKNARRLEEQKVHLSEKDEDKIRSRFVMAKETLLPLETQIAFTDQLTDQIIYRLYGLTEKEIALVEGA